MGRAVRVLALSGLTILAIGCRGGAALPPLPAFQNQNEASIERFVEADRKARAEESADAIGRLGMLYHSYQFLDEARRCYEIARALDPRDARWIYYGAKVEKTAFRYEASEALFEKALASTPRDAEILAELGDLYLMWGRGEEAARNLEKALELEPREPVAALGKARLAVLRQDWPRAIEILVPLLERHPRLSRAHQYLAAAYGATGERQMQSIRRRESTARPSRALGCGSSTTSRWMPFSRAIPLPAPDSSRSNARDATTTRGSTTTRRIGDGGRGP
jgi:tetratricopeptide (TPR) repeat protein